MTTDELLDLCRKLGWIAKQGRSGWWHITPLWMTEPQSISAATLQSAYELSAEWGAAAEDWEGAS